MLITIQANTIQELDEIVARLGAKQPPAAAPAAPSRTEAPKVEEAKTPKTETPKTPAKSDVAQISYAKDVAPLILRMAEDKGRDAVKALFSTFGVGKGPELKAEQYGEVIEAINSALMA
jgi:hypothetical protein